MSSSGALSGTIALGSGGGATVFTVTATDGTSTISRRFTLLTRAPNPSVLSIQTLPTLTDLSVGQSTANAGRARNRLGSVTHETT